MTPASGVAVAAGFGHGRPQIRAEPAAVRWSFDLLDQATDPLLQLAVAGLGVTRSTREPA